jgi:hypothetical protein
VEAEADSQEAVVKLVVLAVVLVVEILLRTVQEVVVHHHLVKVMLVAVVVAVELTHFVAAEAAEVLVQLVLVVGTAEAEIIFGVVTAVLVRLLQSQVHL